MATETARAIEAILMVADQPVPPELFAQLLEMPIDQVTAVIDELMASYEVEDRGFILTKVAGGYRYQSHPDQAPYVERFVLEGQSARLSAAALETLAIIAYKQPISRAQVAQVRGVNVDGVVKTLEQRGYIAEIGRDPGPGNPSLFGTTDEFLLKLGLASLADLPPIAGFVPGPEVVEQLEQGLRADIDAETAAYVADLAERADDVAATEAAEAAADEVAVPPAAIVDDITGEPVPVPIVDDDDATDPAEPSETTEPTAADATDPTAGTGTADTADDSADTADETADTADETADTADETADTADETADTADDSVDTADDSVDTADDTAPEAVADAGRGAAIEHEGSFGDPAAAAAGIDLGATFGVPAEPEPLTGTDADDEDDTDRGVEAIESPEDAPAPTGPPADDV